MRHLEFSNAPELLYHLRDTIGQFRELQNGFTLNEKQRTRIQPTPGYDYDLSSYLDLQSEYEEKGFEKLDATDQKGCSISVGNKFDVMNDLTKINAILYLP